MFIKSPKKMKKSYFFRTFATMILIGVSIFAINSCKKSVGSTDLLADPVIIPQSVLEINVLDALNKDSLAGFTLTVTDPKNITVIANATADRKYLVPIHYNAAVGDYQIVISKLGFVTETRTMTVSSLIKTFSLNIPTTVQMTKSAQPVTLTLATGGKIPIASSAGAIGPPVASLTMPAGTIVTRADGSIETAAISIAATNMAPANFPSTSGDVVLSSLPPANGSVPMKSLNFAPDGLRFDKGLIVGMYIGDALAGLSPSEVSGVLAKMTLDNKGEKIPVDHLSPAKDSAFFKIFHFSSYDFDLGYKLHKKSEEETSVDVSATATFQCNQPVTGKLSKRFMHQSAMLCKLLGLKVTVLQTSVDNDVYKDAIPGAKWVITATVHTVTYDILDANGNSSNVDYPIPTGVMSINYDFITCHNQGGN